MVKQTQTIRRQIADELFECDHFVGLAPKGLKTWQVDFFKVKYSAKLQENVFLNNKQARK